MAQMFRAGALAVALAATTTVSAPVQASAPAGSVPSAFALSRYQPQGDVAERHRCRWRGCGWGGGWDRGWRRDRVDAGDVILGAAIIGGIIAIANSAERRERDRDVIVYDRVPRPRDGEWVRRDDRRARPTGTSSGSGLDNAASLCADAAERRGRVESVDSVARNASGWDVTGTLASGEGFRCHIGNDGLIRSVDFGDGFAGAGNGQWSDDAYAAARSGLGGSVRPDLAVQEASVEGGAVQVARAPAAAAASRMPAYPGGPIPGEEIPETAPEPVRAP
ncbi:hypothetical protein ACLBKU_11055 [Erythrobacter sp. NE805]|uniref:hypothetical protein n=1 Tax=Erythrobacter sp. NE805 TaxID=3389875 RepID=UPI00396B28E0